MKKIAMALIASGFAVSAFATTPVAEVAPAASAASAPAKKVAVKKTAPKKKATAAKGKAVDHAVDPAKDAASHETFLAFCSCIVKKTHSLKAVGFFFSAVAKRWYVILNAHQSYSP